MINLKKGDHLSYYGKGMDETVFEVDEVINENNLVKTAIIRVKKLE